jgi:C-terminal region of peptidase_M24
MSLISGPGIYLPSLLGIRLKNVYLVTPCTMPEYTFLHPTLAKRPKFMKLQVLDYIPFQRKMVMEALVTEGEWDMLRGYHSECMRRLGEECSTDAGRGWFQHEAGAWL